MESKSEQQPAKRERTWQRILDVAARAFRKHGIDGIGLRDIMKQSGLTPGGFYFHFRDKEALFAEATRSAVGTDDEWLYESIKRAPPGKELQCFIAAYLSREHRDHLEIGCKISALGADVARGNDRRRREFSKFAATMVERISSYIPAQDPATRRARAGVLMASMAGVLTVSRILVDKHKSDALLAEARRFFSASLQDS